MNKQKIQSRIEILEKQLAELKEELNKPENKVFKPKIDDIYYCSNSRGEILSCTWNDDNVDNLTYAIGNCFRTREDAEFEVERLKVIAELKRFAKKHNEPIDWNDRSTEVYYIAYNYLGKNVGIYFTLGTKCNDIYFSSSELAQQAVEQIGEERIKKYYLGVE